MQLRRRVMFLAMGVCLQSTDRVAVCWLFPRHWRGRPCWFPGFTLPPVGNIKK